jgi:hypothetical protein
MKNQPPSCPSACQDHRFAGCVGRREVGRRNGEIGRENQLCADGSVRFLITGKPDARRTQRITENDPGTCIDSRQRWIERARSLRPLSAPDHRRGRRRVRWHLRRRGWWPATGKRQETRNPRHRPGLNVHALKFRHAAVQAATHPARAHLSDRAPRDSFSMSRHLSRCDPARV